jgi:predicted Zn-dependent protease
VNRFAVRLALLALALLVGGWLVLGLRAVRLEEQANATIQRARTGPVAPADVNRALDDLAEAGRLSPDQAPLIDQGELLAAAHRNDEARAIAKRVTEVEPDNLQGWYLAWVVADPDKRAKAHAKRRLLELNPWFSEVLRRAAVRRQRR